MRSVGLCTILLDVVYQPVQFAIRDRRGLARWIQRRIVARCRSRRQAAEECGVNERVFNDLCNPPRSRSRRRLSPDTFRRLVGGAFHVNGKTGASALICELLVLVTPPAGGIWSYRRPRGLTRSAVPARFVRSVEGMKPPTDPRQLARFEKARRTRTRRWVTTLDES